MKNEIICAAHQEQLPQSRHAFRLLPVSGEVHAQMRKEGRGEATVTMLEIEPTH